MRELTTMPTGYKPNLMTRNLLDEQLRRTLRCALATVLLLLFAVVLLAGAVIIPQATRLGLPWDLATLRQPDEIKHRVRAILSAIAARPVATQDMVAIAYTDLPPLGVNTFLEQEVDEATIRRSMEMIRAAGFTWIRQQFAWYEIERPAKGQYVDSATGGSSWEKYDRIVNLANEYGLDVLARLDTVPAWARPEDSTFTHPPSDVGDYADFVRTLVSRYRGRLRYYQLWNEPNLSFEWGNQPVKASDFVPLLKAGYLAAKQADPQAVVVAPALAPTIDRGPDNRNDTLYLREMYAAGAKGYFDVMATMAYGLVSGPDDRRLDPFWQVNFSRPILLRQIMVENGDANKPIWFSELAWNALPPSFTEKPLYGRVTEDQQARYTVRGLQRIREEWPWAGPAFVWFFRRPTDNEKDQQFYYFRLVEPNFRPLPVYNAIKDAAPSLKVVQRGWRAPTDWAITVTGDWQTTPGDVVLQRFSATPGSALSFTFVGSTLSVQARGPGRLYVDVAGTRLPRDDEARAYVDLPAATTQVELVRGLAVSPHPVVLTLGSGQATIEGIIVDRQEGFPTMLVWAAAIFVGVWAIGWQVFR